MSSRRPGSGAGGRWSDGETTALINAWGPLHLQLGRGSLSPKEWRLVARAVNAHRAAAGHRFNRSRIQCQKRVYTLKDQYKKELSKQARSGWRHFSQLQAFLAIPDGPPPGFPAKTPASVKKEDEEEMVGGGRGLVGSGAAAGCCPAWVVTKLAGVYERVEMAKLNVDKEKVEMEREKIACWKNLEAVKVEKLDETDLS